MLFIFDCLAFFRLPVNGSEGTIVPQFILRLYPAFFPATAVFVVKITTLPKLYITQIY
jgi:hypothetical protein